MNRSDAEARWHAIWARRGWSARLLWPLSVLYGALVATRRQRYAQGKRPVKRLPVPVIVVGNVVVGGAGKTPTVLALLAHLLERGWTPGVVSRGHGRRGQDILALTPDTPASEGGDEPTLIHRRTGVPVFVGRHRAEAARALLAQHPEVNLLLCDDGLQHLALGRDIGIAVFDDRKVTTVPARTIVRVAQRTDAATAADLTLVEGIGQTLEVSVAEDDSTVLDLIRFREEDRYLGIAEAPAAPAAPEPPPDRRRHP